MFIPAAYNNEGHLVLDTFNISKPATLSLTALVYKLFKSFWSQVSPHQNALSYPQAYNKPITKPHIMILLAILVLITNILIRICLLCLAIVAYQQAVKHLRLHDKYFAILKSMNRYLSFSIESFAAQFGKGTKTADELTAEMPGAFTMFGRLPLNAITLAAREEESKQILEEAINRPLPIGA